MSESFLITGVPRLIGANLTRRLIKKSAEVHIFTRRESNRWRIGDILISVFLEKIE